MSRRLLCLFPVLLFLAYAGSAAADSDRGQRAAANATAKDLDQIVYKGLIGNALDSIPMDPARRVSLQRTNAIISNTLSGRTLATLAGLSNPVFLIGGLAWGVWAASNIRPEEGGANTAADAGRPVEETTARPDLVALLDGSATGNRAPATVTPQTVSGKSISAVEAEPAAHARPPMLKVWLPQRAYGAGYARP